jgi:hypothetical protein
MSNGDGLAGISTGEPWSEAAIRDLRRCIALGDSLEDTASFLCRSQQEVREKALQLELRLPWTEDDHRGLKAELEAGRSIPEIANKLIRSGKDVEWRMREIGFPDRFFQEPNERRDAS